ncbi:MAG: cysteine desulfurase family protein [Thermodesulfobacteriota bacterium]
MRTINLDHLSFSPVLPEVKEAMLPFLGQSGGNPLSRHGLGSKPREALEEARAEVAGLINCHPEEVIFTSCGSESNNFAIRGLAGATIKGHIVASPVEHHSVLHPLRRLERQGYEVSWLTVDMTGKVNPDEVLSSIKEDTILVSITSASNEIGTLEPIGAIGQITRDRGVLLHTDAVACAGSTPIDVRSANIDLLSLSSNTLYGPQGVGALYVRTGVRLMPLIEGGIQEGGLRAGTHNLPGIVGLGVAARLAKERMSHRQAHLERLRDRLIHVLCETIPDCSLTGHPVERLPGHASFSMKFVEGESIVLHLNLLGMAAASGSTCSSEALKTSHVLKAIGLDPISAQGSVVFSLGIENSDEDLELLLSELPVIVERLRGISPLARHPETSHPRA